MHRCTLNAPVFRIRIFLGPGPDEEGGNISKSLAHLSPGVAPPPRFESVEGDSGNGSLMRLAPIAIFYSGDLEQCMHYARESSYTTHPGHIAAECCALLAFLIAQAINDPALPVADMEDFSARHWLEMQIYEYLRTVLGERTGDGVDEVRQLLQSNEPEVKAAQDTETMPVLTCPCMSFLSRHCPGFFYAYVGIAAEKLELARYGRRR